MKKTIAGFSHLNERGQAHMVNVGPKPATERHARAEAWVDVGRRVATQLRKAGATAKGDVLGTARIAGIFAAKQTASLIPLCHPLSLTHVEVEAEIRGDRVRLEARAGTVGSTGVEMEAMTAVSVAALTVYDMCKALNKGIRIGPIRLLEKAGGKSGHWVAEGHS